MKKSIKVMVKLVIASTLSLGAYLILPDYMPQDRMCLAAILFMLSGMVLKDL